MIKKNIYILIFLLQIGGIINAQTDSTDLNFYSTTPVYENEDDSLMFPSDMFSQYFVEFDLEDTISPETIVGTDTTDAIILYNIHIELHDQTNGNIIFRETYSISELQSLGYMTGLHVLLDFGTFENYFTYSVLLTKESTANALFPSIKKNL